MFAGAIIVEKKKILVIASTYPRWRHDHEPAFVHELSRRLVPDFEVYVLCPHAPGAKRQELMDGVWVNRFWYAPASVEVLVQNGGIIANLKFKPWKWLLVVPFLLSLLINSLFLIRKIKPDVIHSHWLIPQGAILAILNTTFRLPPILLTSHGGDLFGLKGKLSISIKKWILASAVCTTVVSNKMRDLATKLGADAEKVHVLPMGVDFAEQFSPDISIIRNKLEILYVGRFVEKKGVKYLIEAFAAVHKMIPSAILTVVGYGPEEKMLHELADSLSLTRCINFKGALEQRVLPSLYRSCTLLVAPFVKAESGDQEGFPVALVEAIACGTPIIAGNLAVLMDVFGDKADELTCDPKDTHCLAQKIISVLQSPMANEAAVIAVRKELSANLDWSSVARQYKILLRQLMT